MLIKLNSRLEKLLPYLTPCSVALGIIFASFLSSLSYLIPWIFAIISFTSSLGIKLNDLKKVMFAPLPIILCFIVLQVVMPIIAYGFGFVFFRNDPYTMTGIILGFILPTAVISLIWVSIYNGNKSLALLIILINTMLSPIIVPLSLNIFVGTKVTMNVADIASGIFFMIVLPSILAIAANHWFSKKIVEQASIILKPSSKLAIILIVSINSSIVAPILKEVNSKFFVIIITVLIVAITGYVIGFLSAKLLGWSNDIIISFTYTSGMRNIGAGAALATLYFPPAVALPVIIMILFQQSLAAIMGSSINKLLVKKQTEQKQKVVNV